MYCIPKVGQGRSGFSFTALITGEIQYFSFLGVLMNMNFFGTPAVEAIILGTTSILAVGDMVKSSPCRPSVSYLPEIKLANALPPG